MTFFIVLFILLMQFLWRYIDELVGKGLEFNIIAELLVYASSSLVTLALPLAVLLSSLMAFGNMGEYYELTAIKSSGISLQRIMFPLVILVTGIAFGAFFFANNVLPVTNLKMKSLLYDVRQQRPEVQITPGVFYNGIDNYSIRVNEKNPVTNILYGLKIYDHSAHRGNIVVTIADSGQMKMTSDRRNLIVTLWNGYSYSELEESRRKNEKSYPHRTDKFAEQRIIIAMSGFELLRSDERIFRNSYAMMNIDQLERAIDSLQHELNTKSTQFYYTLLHGNYFKINYGNTNRPDAYLPHSLTNVPQVPHTTLNQNPTITETRSAITKKTEIKKKDQQIEKKPVIRPKPESTSKPSITPRPLVKSDSAKTLKPVVKIANFDSLYTCYSKDNKMSIVKNALNYSTMVQYTIANNATTIDFDTKYLRRHEIEWHRKFTLSFACLIFLFIGAPLGAIIRKGGLGMPTVISTLLFIIDYVLSLTGEKFVRESVMSSFQGMWLSSFVLLVVAVFLTYEATNDSAILNTDTYLTWLRDKLGLRKSIMLERKFHLTGKFDLLEITKEQLQLGFNSIHDQAHQCLFELESDTGFLVLVKKTFHNIGYSYLLEFGIHYNSVLDQAILSKWFRIPYFQKRLAEFPFINGRVTSKQLKNKSHKWLSVIIFPIWCFRFVKIKVKLRRLRSNLSQVIELSAGMVNLLNSSAMKIDVES
jgi:lipopolysaccharide export system permease protein